MQKFRDVLSRWEARALSAMDAAELLGCSERQFRRLRKRFDEEGLEGLRDRRLAKPSGKRVPASERDRMLDLYRREYDGWNVKHFHEQLRQHHSFKWGYTWTKTQLHAAGLVTRAKRRGAHRRKRPRKPYEGMMLHQDASTEVWLEGQAALDLVVTMDDATSTIYSAFLIDEEGTMSTFQGLLEVFAAKGLPSSVYTDRGSHYFYTPKAGAAVDKSRLTQVGRALKQLGISHIPAYSPEARGRSERMFATLQDRLIKELAKAGISDIEAANRWIVEDYLPRHNDLFAKPPELTESAFVAVADKGLLADICCVQGERQVGRDNTVSWAGKRLQLPASPLRHHWVKARVRVHEYPDGALAIFHGPRRIARYDGEGVPTATRVAPCSKPSRPSPAGGREVRPALRAPARDATRKPQGRDGETDFQAQTKKLKGKNKRAAVKAA